MGTGPHQFSTTPLDNQTADARGQWPVGMPAKAVDAAARGNMATIALARDDNLGGLVAVLGASNIYSVNTGQGLVDPASIAGGQAGKITKPFSLKLRFGAALAGSATNAPRLKVDGVDCGPLLRRDGTALADGDLSTTAPVEIYGDMAASGDTAVTRVRVLALTPGELAVLIAANAATPAAVQAAAAAAADAQANSVRSMRFVYAGTLGNDVGSANYPNFPNPYGGYACVVDRWSAPAPNQTGGNAIVNLLFRYLQMYIPSQGWITVGAAS